MAVSTITYSNKVALNENQSVADINKVKADDMNEIKKVVNNNATETSKNTTDIANITGTILWTNPNPNQAMGSQSLNLEDNDCDVFEIFYKIYSSRNWIGSVRFLKGYGATLQNTDYADALANGYRQITGSTQTSISIGTYQHSNYTVDNNAMVPIYVIGYKTGLFN